MNEDHKRIILDAVDHVNNKYRALAYEEGYEEGFKEGYKEGYEEERLIAKKTIIRDANNSYKSGEISESVKLKIERACGLSD